VCACSSQSWRPCQSCGAGGWKLEYVCSTWGVSISDLCGRLGFLSVPKRCCLLLLPSRGQNCLWLCL